MLLLRGATDFGGVIEFGDEVSIHAPLARSNLRRRECTYHIAVSIHAPLARSNIEVRQRDPLPLFQYMLLLRGATPENCRFPNGFQFQYMLLLRGATTTLEHTIHELAKFQYMLLLRGATCKVPRTVREPPVSFNTCSSCEEQLNAHAAPRCGNLFQYMLLLRGATTNCIVLLTREQFQYMLLLRGAT